MKDDFLSFDDFDELFFGVNKKKSGTEKCVKTPGRVASRSLADEFGTEEIEMLFDAEETPREYPISELSARDALRRQARNPQGNDAEGTPAGKRDGRIAGYGISAGDETISAGGDDIPARGNAALSARPDSSRESRGMQPACKADSGYSTDGSFLRQVTVKQWPIRGGLYDKFRRDAIAHRELHGRRAAHVSFFSYLPSYSNLNSAQWEYYLYMRDSVAQGIGLPDADLSYVLLYIYEIINLGGVITPEAGAERLAAVWLLYRQIHPMLDKYMSEWMADYCLMYKTEVPAVLRAHLPRLSLSSTVKEFYADAIIKYCPSRFGEFCRTALSDYSISKSRYASKYEDYEEKVCRVFDRTIEERLKTGGVFPARLMRPSSVTRAVFCGAICASDIKKELELKVTSPFRSAEARRIVTELIKGAENAVRAGLGIRARLNAPKLESAAANEASDTREEREYLELYDAPSRGLSAENASELERVSWQNAARLTDSALEIDLALGERSQADESGALYTEENELPEGALVGGDEPCEAYEACGYGEECEAHGEREELAECGESTDTAVATAGVNLSGTAESSRHAPTSAEYASESTGDGEESLKSRLGTQLYSLVLSAASGESFADACRAVGMFADDAARCINEHAADVIGDVLLEVNGTDYSFVEDYRELL